VPPSTSFTIHATGRVDPPRRRGTAFLQKPDLGRHVDWHHLASQEPLLHVERGRLPVRGCDATPLSVWSRSQARQCPGDERETDDPDAKRSVRHVVVSGGRVA
jgi:hypothetical protein